MEIDIGQGTLDAVTAPYGIFLCESQDRIDDDLSNAWPASKLSLVSVVPLLFNQRPVPAENGIGRKQSANLYKYLAAEELSLFVSVGRP